ncbi:dUTPase [Bacillus spizizenii]|nr:dUTPase [Bacillus spizizenii]
MNDRLNEMFTMQTALDERVISERNVNKSHDEWVLGITLAMESEIDEIRREVNWKWWKNPKQVDTKALQGEVIDMWHFLLSLSRIVGLTPESIYEVYMAKNAENHARQDGTSEKEGYAKGDDDDYETIICDMCFEAKSVDKGTWAYDRGMCEPCYAKYQG